MGGKAKFPDNGPVKNQRNGNHGSEQPLASAVNQLPDQAALPETQGRPTPRQ